MSGFVLNRSAPFKSFKQFNRFAPFKAFRLTQVSGVSKFQLFQWSRSGFRNQKSGNVTPVGRPRFRSF